MHALRDSQFFAFAVLASGVALSAPCHAQCDLTTSVAAPLCDFGAAEYAPLHPGGLYPGGTSIRPLAHEAAGLALALASVVPRDASGAPAIDGRIGLVSIGMSNTAQEFAVFVADAVADLARNPRVTVINGAQGGETATDWATTDVPWTVLASRLATAALAPQQVQIAWVKLANSNPGAAGGAFPAHADTLRDETEVVLRRLKDEFPLLSIAYLSSRTRSGNFVAGSLNPEPFAFESGFAMRWIIEDQLNGVGDVGYSGPSAAAPWLAWGPYLWADGLSERSDGFTWTAADLITVDCTHPATPGRVKVADLLTAFFKTDPTSTPWYLRATAPVDAPLVSVMPTSAAGAAPLAISFAATAIAASGAWTITEYAWGFGDGCASLVEDPSKVFAVPGLYTVRLTVSDSAGHTSQAVIPIEVTSGATPLFVRGDCNDDGGRNIADAIALLSHLFDGATGFAPTCLDACDANDDGLLDLADAIAVLTALFGAPGVPLPPPGVCGADPAGADPLACGAFTHCAP